MSHPGVDPDIASVGSSARILRLACGFYGVLLLVAFAWRTLLYGESLLFDSAAAAARGVRPIHDGAIGVAVGLALVVVSRVWSRRTRAGAALTRALAALLGRLRPGQVVVLALTSGIAEEAFFRGAVQPRVGLVFASLIFGVAHFAPQRDLRVWAPATLLAGFVLGGLYAWTGNLVAPAVAHIVVNGLNLHWLSREA